ncbi:hypothetical protein [Dactylosporangium matsuzakiense]|uniref:hypothetical protein n=1 Tax=Dactylosporangium matsuzakiense TaxID=53360 RepID=UPI0021C4A196|nr:hypothetical protein [Dactylosporangium matsuzakiense]UWZ44879.1 hypothetical protein Dmats_47535 [Dactylosporangium matsuzakiense]
MSSHEEPASVVPRERRRPDVIALVLAAIGLGLAAAAEYLPWGSVALTRGETDISSSIGGSSADRVVEVPLTNLSPAHVAVYLITLTATLAALAVVLTATGAGVRRVAAGVTGGLLAANALVLVGLSSVIQNVGGSELELLLGRPDNVSHGPGYLLAYAATLMLAAALAMAVWAPARSLGRRRDEEPEGGEALELSVTPVPPTFQ